MRPNRFSCAALSTIASQAATPPGWTLAWSIIKASRVVVYWLRRRPPLIPIPLLKAPFGLLQLLLA